MTILNSFYDFIYLFIIILIYVFLFLIDTKRTKHQKSKTKRDLNPYEKGRIHVDFKDSKTLDMAQSQDVLVMGTSGCEFNRHTNIN